MNKEIESWLSSKKKNYQEGLSLLEKYGKNKILLNNLKRKENDFHRGKLIYELKKINASAPISLKKKAEKKKIFSKPSAKADGNKAEVKIKTAKQEEEKFITIPGEEPKEIVDWRIEIGHLYNQRGRLSNSLRNFAKTDNEGRKKVLQQIDLLTEHINALYEQINYFQKNGKPMPEEKAKEISDKGKAKELPSDPVELMKLRNNLRSNLSKTKTKMAVYPVKHEKRVRYESKIASLEKQILEVENKIQGK